PRPIGRAGSPQAPVAPYQTKNARTFQSARVKTTLPSSLSFDRQFHIHRTPLLRERTAQFGKRNVLQLTNALPRNTKLFTYFLERLGFSAVQTETLEDDLLFAVIQDVQQTSDLVSQIFITQQLERRLRFLVANDFAKLGRIVIADR